MSNPEFKESAVIIDPKDFLRMQERLSELESNLESHKLALVANDCFDDQFAKMNVYQKVSWVIGNLDKLPKSGRNKFSNYSYLLESDMLEALRPLMSECRMVAIPNYEVLSEVEALFTVEGKMIIINSDNPADRLGIHLIAESIDKDRNGNRMDKGYYQCYTNFEKYGLMKIFMVSSGDDVEGNGSDNPDDGSGKPGPGKQGQKGKPFQDDHQEPRKFKTKYPNKCLKCQIEIKAGDLIYLVDKKAICPKCFESGDSTESSPPPSEEKPEATEQDKVNMTILAIKDSAGIAGLSSLMLRFGKKKDVFSKKNQIVIEKALEIKGRELSEACVDKMRGEAEDCQTSEEITDLNTKWAAIRSKYSNWDVSEIDKLIAARMQILMSAKNEEVDDYQGEDEDVQF